MLLESVGLVAVSVPLALAVVARQATGLQTRGNKPKLPYDDKTTPYCTWWIDNDGTQKCQDVPGFWGATTVDFLRWNPSITSDCGNFKSGQSYCVEAAGEPPVIVTTRQPTSNTTSATSTSTKPSNGIPTPQPTQPGMVDNCDKFYFVKRGDTCANIAAANGISVEKFLAWNAQAGKDCTSLWADAYACVSVIGHDPGTPTNPPNGIETPKPTQPDIVPVCNKFHFVKAGQTCIDVADENGIALVDFLSWNPKANNDCSGLWANTYACVSVIALYDFSDGTLSGWSVTDGTYDAKSKALVASNSPGGKALINAAYSDFIFEADITIPSPSGNAGLVFRVSNPGSGADNYRGYYAGIGTDGNGYVVLGRANNDWSQLSSVQANIRPGEVHHVKVQATGDILAIFVDDMSRPKIVWRDGTYRSGMSGVRVFQTGATFDNVKISPLVFDGFEKNMVGWTIYDGTFDAGSKSLVASDTFSGKAVLNTRFNDFIFEVDISISKPSDGNAGVIFRASNLDKGPDAYSGYYAGIGTRGFITLGRAGNSWNELGNVGADVRAGQVYHLMVRAVGDALDIYVDDMSRPKISLKDGTFKRGVIGARVFQTGAVYDNFRIQKL